MTQQKKSKESSSSNNGFDEEIQSPRDWHDECPRLTEAQLQLPTSELYKAKHIPSGKSKNDFDNFVGKYNHVCYMSQCDSVMRKAASDKLMYIDDDQSKAADKVGL